MRVLVIQHEELVEPGALLTWVEQARASVHVARPDKGEALPAPDGFDLIVILGGSMDVPDAERLPWLSSELEWVRSLLEAGGGSSPVPLLGICLGAQIIAAARGAHVGPMPTPERGWHELSLTRAARSHHMTRRLPERFEVFESHRQGFELPAGATLLGTTHGWEPQMFALGPHTLGVQFHPEFTEEIVRKLFDPTKDTWEGPHVRSIESFFDDPQRFERQHQVLFHLLDELTTPAFAAN